jgi:hypothetical protein
MFLKVCPVHSVDELRGSFEISAARNAAQP